MGLGEKCVVEMTVEFGAVEKHPTKHIPLRFIAPRVSSFMGDVLFAFCSNVRNIVFVRVRN